jgi:hypothetical protein
MSPIIKKSHFDQEYQKHQQLRSLIKKRQMPPMVLASISSHTPAKPLASTSSKMHVACDRSQTSLKSIGFDHNSIISKFPEAFAPATTKEQRQSA